MLDGERKDQMTLKVLYTCDSRVEYWTTRHHSDTANYSNRKELKILNEASCSAGIDHANETGSKSITARPQ